MKVLLTGASGFVGHHVLAHLLDETDWTFVCPVTMMHKGSSQRIVRALRGYHVLGGDLSDSALEAYGERAGRVTVIAHDLTMPFSPDEVAQLYDVELILNVASESHVDRSLEDPTGFVRNNVHLMLNVLELARQVRPRLFLHMSTDEVYGPAYGGERHREGEPHRPSNPYSASKSAQEAIALAYWRSYDLPIIITNTMNIFGEAQDPEKFVTKIIRQLHTDKPITVPAAFDPGNEPFVPPWQPGSRFYLHAENLASAWLFMIRHALRTGVATFRERIDMWRVNVVGELEIRNDSMVHRIARIMHKTPEIEYVDFHSSRPGHDLRYALDGTVLANMGWQAPVPLNVGLERTIEWTLAHPEWLH